MEVRHAIFILGIVLTIGSILIPTLESQMWWNQPSNLEHGVNIMREITPSEQLFMSLYKVWPLITLVGIGIIFSDVAIFFIQKRKHNA